MIKYKIQLKNGKEVTIESDQFSLNSNYGNDSMSYEFFNIIEKTRKFPLKEKVNQYHPKERERNYFNFLPMELYTKERHHETVAIFPASEISYIKRV